MKLSILLATYNGEKYIRAQIDSLILNLDYITSLNYEILISDDESNDRTVEIINDYVLKFKFIKLTNKEKKGGAKKNFEYLIKQVDNDVDYVFFCDQDDFWLPEKLVTFISEFNKQDASIPILIHSDLVVADPDLFPLDISMFMFQKLNKTPNIENLIVQNSVTGCVCGINKALLKVIKQCDFKYARMHDWYVAVIALLVGRIIFINRSTILYRQHGNNEVGAKKVTLNGLVKSKKVISKINEAGKSIIESKIQLEGMLTEDIDMSTKQRQILKNYVLSFEKSIFIRMKFFLQGFRKNTFLRNILYFYLYVLKGKKINNKYNNKDD